jgi:hypothetical protein
MDTKRLVAELRAELSRIEKAIAALEALGSAAAPTAQPAPKVSRGRMSAAAREKARWAETAVKKAARKSGTSGTGPRVKR